MHKGLLTFEVVPLYCIFNICLLFIMGWLRRGCFFSSVRFRLSWIREIFITNKTFQTTFINTSIFSKCSLTPSSSRASIRNSCSSTSVKSDSDWGLGRPPWCPPCPPPWLWPRTVPPFLDPLNKVSSCKQKNPALQLIVFLFQFALF